MIEFQAKFQSSISVQWVYSENVLVICILIKTSPAKWTRLLLAAVHGSLYPYLNLFIVIFCPRENICMADKQSFLITRIQKL